MNKKLFSFIFIEENIGFNKFPIFNFREIYRCWRILHIIKIFWIGICASKNLWTSCLKNISTEFYEISYLTEPRLRLELVRFSANRLVDDFVKSWFTPSPVVVIIEHMTWTLNFIFMVQKNLFPILIYFVQFIVMICWDFFSLNFLKGFCNVGVWQYL